MLAPPPKRCDHVCGGHGLAVMEGHPFAEPDRDRLAVVANLLSGSEWRLRRIVCIEGMQSLEYVMGDGGGEIGGHDMLVEAGR